MLEVGNLDPLRDFLDVRDVCAAYVACIERWEALAPGAILNIGSGEPRRIGDILDELLAWLAGITAEVRTAPARTRGPEVARVVADAGRARALLGWAPRRALHETLMDVLEDCRTRLRAAGAP